MPPDSVDCSSGPIVVLIGLPISPVFRVGARQNTLRFSSPSYTVAIYLLLVCLSEPIQLAADAYQHLME